MGLSLAVSGSGEALVGLDQQEVLPNSRDIGFIDPQQVGLNCKVMAIRLAN